jgi:hypothetical protein
MMSIRKFGTAEGQGVTGTEGPLSKTAAAEDWTPSDDEALAAESAEGDTPEDLPPTGE